MSNALPKHLPQGVSVVGLQFNADFQSQALNLPVEIAMPASDTFRTCTMRGHDGSYHSQDIDKAIRHAVYHDLYKTLNHASVAEENLVDRVGNHKHDNVRGLGFHEFDPTRFDYWLKTHHLSKASGGLIQQGFNAGPDPYHNMQRPAIHTSWLQTICRRYSNDKGNHVFGNGKGEVHIEERNGLKVVNFGPDPDVGVFRKNVFMEMEVDYSRMKTGAHRHSWWLMNLEPGKSYNDIYDDGSEIDMIEHEVNEFIKCLAGKRYTVNEIPSGIQRETLVDGTQVAVGVPTIRGDEEANMHREGAIRIPGINRKGFQTIGLLWEVDNQEDGRLRFFVNGVEVVRDSEIVPLRDTLMYMILSREGNEEHGLSGKSIFDFIDTLEEDEVLVKSVRAWVTSTPSVLDPNPSRLANNINYETNGLVSIVGTNGQDLQSQIQQEDESIDLGTVDNPRIVNGEEPVDKNSVDEVQEPTIDLYRRLEKRLDSTVQSRLVSIAKTQLELSRLAYQEAGGLNKKE